MKYNSGMELICIRGVKRKRGENRGQINFIKGKTYKVEDVYQKEFHPAVRPIYIRLINEQGDVQPIAGKNKTKYFKIPRPEGVPVTPPPAPKSKAEKESAKKAKREALKKKKAEEEQQHKEWERVRKLRVKDKSKRIFKKVSGF